MRKSFHIVIQRYIYVDVEVDVRPDDTPEDIKERAIMEAYELEHKANIVDSDAFVAWESDAYES